MILCTQQFLLFGIRLDCIEVEQVLHSRQQPTINPAAMLPVFRAQSARQDNSPHKGAQVSVANYQLVIPAQPPALSIARTKKDPPKRVHLV